MREFIAPHFGTEITYKLPMSNNVQTLPKALIKKLNSPADMGFLAQGDIKDFFMKTKRFSFDEEQSKKLDQLFVLIEERLGYSVFRNIEKTKRELSSVDETLYKYDYHGIDIEENIKFEKYLEGSSKETSEIMKALDKTFETAAVEYKDIELICLTGGTAKMRQLKSELVSRFGEKIINEHDNFQSVIKGLAERAFQAFFKS